MRDGPIARPELRRGHVLVFGEGRFVPKVQERQHANGGNLNLDRLFNDRIRWPTHEPSKRPGLGIAKIRRDGSRTRALRRSRVGPRDERGDLRLGQTTRVLKFPVSRIGEPGRHLV